MKGRDAEDHTGKEKMTIQSRTADRADSRLRDSHAGKLKTFLIGTDIQKSISPAIHNYLYQKFDLNASYSLVDVQTRDFHSRIRKILEAEDVLGFNVTAPFKERIIPLLTSLDQKAKCIGAVNTVKQNSGGKTRGYNTDVDGIVASLSKLRLIRPEGRTRVAARADKKVILLGAGGAARACTYVLLRNGFDNLAVMNRTENRATIMLSHFKIEFKDTRMRVLRFDEQSLNKELANCDLLINAISESKESERFPLKVDLSTAKRGMRYLDLGYKKESEILRIARKSHIASLDGLTMLAEQAARSFEIWTGISPSRRMVLSVAKSAIQETRARN